LFFPTRNAAKFGKGNAGASPRAELRGEKLGLEVIEKERDAHPKSPC